MNIHEYQAKELLRRVGVPVQPGEVAETAAAAEAIAARYATAVVIKAQVHAGGRGKAGGVKLAKTPAEARAHAERIIGMSIKGLVVQRVLVAQAADIASESYVGIIVDRVSKRPVVMVSPAGGIDIEEVAATTPEKIRRVAVDPRYGLQPFEAMQCGFFLYRDLHRARAAARILRQLYEAFMDSGASLAEINPLVSTPAGELVAVDAKISIDDNELDRHPELAALRDETAEAPSETEARKANLTFIKLEGNVGCVVNGAGLAMATMDLVKYYGGEPANFLDIRRIVQPRESRERAPDHYQRSAGSRDSLQHLRRHHAYGRCGQRDRDRDSAAPAPRPARDSPHGHQRGGSGAHSRRRWIVGDDGHG